MKDTTDLLRAGVERSPVPRYAASNVMLRAAPPVLVAKRGQAAALGQTWAERVCRGEYRRRDAWPQHEPRTIAIARRLVANLAHDSRLLDDLAIECNAGAARWWERRPATYRREPAR
jgi:hypothetical protein